jgi:hypothetical protein
MAPAGSRLTQRVSGILPDSLQSGRAKLLLSQSVSGILPDSLQSGRAKLLLSRFFISAAGSANVNRASCPTSGSAFVILLVLVVVLVVVLDSRITHLSRHLAAPKFEERRRACRVGLLTVFRFSLFAFCFQLLDTTTPAPTPTPNLNLNPARFPIKVR